MNSNSIKALLISLKRIGAMNRQINEIDKEAKAVWADIKPLALGLKVRRYGHDYQLSSGSVFRGVVMVSGRRISPRTGLPGAREFSLGYLGNCELIDEPADAPEDVQPAAH